jgi:hypothetical protein
MKQCTTCKQVKLLVCFETEDAEQCELCTELGQDYDLGLMSADGLMTEVLKLRAGIRAHRDATGHNLCWYVPELWALLPDKVEPKPDVPVTEEFLRKCAEYRASLGK